MYVCGQLEGFPEGTNFHNVVFLFPFISKYIFLGGLYIIVPILKTLKPRCLAQSHTAKLGSVLISLCCQLDATSSRLGEGASVQEPPPSDWPASLLLTDVGKPGPLRAVSSLGRFGLDKTGS